MLIASALALANCTSEPTVVPTPVAARAPTAVPTLPAAEAPSPGSTATAAPTAQRTAAPSAAPTQYPVSKPYPFNGASGVSTASDIAWERSPGYGYTYDVYFGTSSNPPLVGEQDRIVYDPGVLLPETTYYWRVDAILGANAYTGKVYSFTTGSAPVQGPRAAENGSVLLSDTFDSLSGNWSPIYLAGGSGGSYTISGGTLNMSTHGPGLVYGVYNTTPLSGHFYVEADYDVDNFAGLALIKQTDGRPDPNNYVMMSLSQPGGKVVVTANDMQDGKADVLGDDYGVPEDHYQVLLDGTQLSVPFVGTAKHFRIMHDAVGGSFRYLFKVQAKLKGQLASGWMETWDSPDWAADPVAQPFYVALLVKSSAASQASVRFDNVMAHSKPTEDRDDTNTGFAINHGEYNWSGQFGDATVITFGAESPYAEQDRKFVFWSESNDVPFWHLNNEALDFNEFIETWEDLNTYPELLCFEPMSDRLRRFAKVEVLEDNAVRKVVRWSYDLVDPNYLYPGDPTGTQAAEAVETYTFYRDGTATRVQRYTPKLDNGLDQQGNEVQEAILAAGSKTWYPDLIAHPATTIYDLEGDVNQYYPNSGNGNGNISTWNQFITSMNMFDGVAPFVAYSNDPRTPDVFPYPVRLGVQTDYDISDNLEGASHWPVQKAPYEYAMWSQSYLTSEAKSWSFSSAGNWAGEADASQWDLNFHKTYQVDARGRKYREWVSLIGMADVGDLGTPRSLTSSWLFPGTVAMTGAGSTFVGNNRHQKTLVFDNRTEDGTLDFSLRPESSTVNLAIEVTNWGGDASLNVTIDGVTQTSGTDYVADMQGTSLLVWFHRTFTVQTSIEVLSAAGH